MTVLAHDPLSQAFQHLVAAHVDAFVAAKLADLTPQADGCEPLVAAAADLAAGGKRVRSAFCVWGFVAVAGVPADLTLLIKVATSLDLLHVSALVHDDLMDDSRTRRGKPAAHVAFAEQHDRRAGEGEAERFGAAGAILLGDLLAMWSEEMFARSGFTPAELEQARPFVEAVRTEVLYGQFLDNLAQTQPITHLTHHQVRQIVDLKTARYTVIRPCQIGAALAGADQEQLDALATFGAHLGRAFQFRDDILGIFGDPATTGKPAGDDIREGKRTVLVARTLEALNVNERRNFAALIGKNDLTDRELDRAKAMIQQSGALAAVEKEIDADLAYALAAIEAVPFTSQGSQGLTSLARLCAHRTS